MAKPIAVLSFNSLFASGIASRLSEHPDLFEVDIILANTEDALCRLRSFNPSIVLVDSTDLRLFDIVSISALLDILPSSKIITLDYSGDEIRIISSEQRKARDTGELISLMQDIRNPVG